MARVRIPLLLCVALLAPVAASAAGGPELRSTSTTVSGVYSVTFNLSIASRLPAGTTISCRAQLVPSSGGLTLLNPRLVAFPAEKATGLAAVNGSTATCATEIPFCWTAASAQGGVVLSYEIDAVSNSGSAPMLLRSSAQQNLGVAFPASGGNASLSLNLTF
jgi:hypothetical protein